MKSIKIEHLTKSYGKNRGVNDINLEIEPGVTYGFIGPNGAGKSTTIKCLMNFINKNSGDILVNGEEVNNKNYKIKENIGYLPSEIHLYEDLTVKAMFEYSASFYKKNCTKKMKSLIKRLEIDTSKKIDELSLGNLKKVGIVLALMHDPDYIIMDEPTSGLDPLMQDVFYNILDEEKKNGKTIFFSSHLLNEVKKVCDKVAIIKNGEIIKLSDISNLEEENVFKVSVKSKKVKDIKKKLKIKNISLEVEDKIEFIYDKDINELISVLAKYEIDNLLIQDLDIEDIFMHYYK